MAREAKSVDHKDLGDIHLVIVDISMLSTHQNVMLVLNEM